MKLRHIVVCMLAAALPATALAIPQTVSSTGLFGSSGVSFEKFASDGATWAPGAVLAGTWSAPGADGARTLTESAVVFGLTAAEVRADQSTDRLARLLVTFRDGGKTRRTLFTRVTQAIAAFTGRTPRDEGRDTKVFRQEQTQIRASSPREGEVVVEFTPAP